MDSNVTVYVVVENGVELPDRARRVFDNFRENGFNILLRHNTSSMFAEKYFKDNEYDNVTICCSDVPLSTKVRETWKLTPRSPRGESSVLSSEEIGYDVKCAICDDAFDTLSDLFCGNITVPIELVSANDWKGTDLIVLDHNMSPTVGGPAGDSKYWQYLDARRKDNNRINVITRQKAVDFDGEVVQMVPIDDATDAATEGDNHE